MKTKLMMILTTIALSACATAAPALNKNFEDLVPKGKVIQTKHDEKKVQTTTGSVVELEYTNAGDLKEASGDFLSKGDEFVPGAGLLNLKAAADAVTSSGKKLTEDWSFEKSFIHGWTYEFEGFENGKKMNYLVDAKSGKIIKEEIDN